MNDLIRELIEQAWVYQVRVLNEPDGSRTYTEKEKVFDKEKFAELIVLECAAMTRNLSAHGELAEKAVKEHFGVEE